MKRFERDKYLKRLEFKNGYRKYGRYFYLGFSCLVVVILGIYFTYSKFRVSKETEVIKTTVGDFIYGDIVVGTYIDGEYSKTFPKDEIGYNVEMVTCDNGATGEWDSFNWKLKITGITKRTKCNVYFVTPASCGINDNVKCIGTREELATMASEVNNGDNKLGKIYYLTNDLDLGGKFDSNGNALDGNISWTPIGTDDNPFIGTFDGNGHVIKNMYITSLESAALFYRVTNSMIKNFGIESSYVESKNGAASSIASTVVDTIIKRVYTSADLNGEKMTSGVAAYALGLMIKDCYNTGKINSNDKQFGAGIIGYLGYKTSSIENCYNSGILNGGTQSGGIVGGLQGVVSNTYNVANLISSSGVGGIVGQLYTETSPIVKNNYNVGKINDATGGGIIDSYFGNKSDYVIQDNYYLLGSANYGVSFLKSDVGAAPLSQDNMPSVLSVINGDNAFVEDTNNINNGYPILRWQAERESN